MKQEKNILIENRAALDGIAHALLEKETINRKDIELIVTRNVKQK